MLVLHLFMVEISLTFSVKDRVDNPISLYAASKKSTELIAEYYSHYIK